jgi:hypothetical protein
MLEGVARRGRYGGPVSNQPVPGGVVHNLPADLRKALITNPTALDAWKDITPLARNEFICWVEDAKQENAAFAEPRRSWRRASVGPAAGQGASTASAPADSSRRCYLAWT